MEELKMFSETIWAPDPNPNEMKASIQVQKSQSFTIHKNRPCTADYLKKNMKYSLFEPKRQQYHPKLITTPSKHSNSKI